MNGAGGTTGGVGQFFTGLIYPGDFKYSFSFKTMTVFELIAILVLAIGGLGLFLRSLKTIEKRYPD